MCEPISISAGAAWALGATAAVTAGAAIYTADQQKEQGKANAALMENNARLDRDRAAAEQAMGDRESEQQLWRTRALLGQQRAAIAANGLDAGIGTPAELLGETAMFGEADAQTIRMNAARNAWGFNASALDKQNQGRLSKWSGKSQATGTLLSGLASTGSTVGGFWA